MLQSFIDWLFENQGNFRLLYKDLTLWEEMEQQFPERGEELLREAAEAGYALAMLWLVFLIKEGKITPRTSEEQIEWLWKAGACSEQNPEYLLDEDQKQLLQHLTERKEELNLLKYGRRYPDIRTGARKKRWDEALAKLEERVGLTELKKEVKAWERMIVGQRARIEQGEQPIGMSIKHLVLIGDAGTGKSTSIPHIQEMLHTLAWMSNDRVVYGSPVDLFERHPSGTVNKVKRLVERARGGMLVLDQLHLIGYHSPNEKVAIDTLVQEMEKGDVFMVLAGHTEDMEDLLRAHRRLRAITQAIRFPAYTEEELVQLFKQRATQEKLEVEPDTEKKLLKLAEDQSAEERNGYSVRTWFEAVVQRQWERRGDEELKLQAISAEDLILGEEQVEEEQAEETAEKFDLETELATFVGNKLIKNHLRMLYKNIEADKRKAEVGLKPTVQSLHMIFTGNPGTGKTTMARMVGRLLKETGALPKGQFVEARREDFVAEYIGQTEAKTKKKIAEALGGVLFIDEAYALYDEAHNDYGREVINILVAEMENHRDNLVVIMAGYEHDMRQLLLSNSGLRDRFPYHFKFKNYTEDELYQILLHLAEGYILADGCEQVIRSILRKGIGISGNGRAVRTLLEKALLHQGVRIVDLDLVEENDLRTLYPWDFKKAEG